MNVADLHEGILAGLLTQPLSLSLVRVSSSMLTR